MSLNRGAKQTWEVSAADAGGRLSAGRKRYLTMPSSGELAVAYSFFGMRPER